MPPTPAAEIDVTEPLVRGLVSSQHPDLADLRLRIVANGWDNVVLRLGDDLALRMPRRALGADLVRHEQRWLPTLGPRLPVATPTPIRVGRPSDGTRGPVYPWYWSVVPWYDGTLVAAIAPADRLGLAVPLADTLAALHRPAPAEAPTNLWRGVPLAVRDRSFRERLAGSGRPDADALLGLWRRLCAAPSWRGPDVWLHGDLHPANLLATPPDTGGAHGLAAVLDFGDLTSGDPATDLATAWLTFDVHGRQRFRSRLSAMPYADDATWARARGWALLLGVTLATGSDDAPMLQAVGRHALTEVLRDV